MNPIRGIHTLNEHIFDVIDTEEKAYWLGFLYADGYVYCSNNHYYCQLRMQARDKAHIELFKNFVQTSVDIEGGYTTVAIGTGSGKEHYSYRLTLSSKTLVDSLIRHGCVQSKTLIVRFPSIESVPQNLVKHFIRGYFDGDGSICADIVKNGKTPTLLFQVCGTKDMLEHIAAAVGIDNKPKQRGNYYDLRCKGNIKAMNIFDYLYNGATIYLERKYKIYSETKHQYQNSRPRTNSLKF